MTPSEYKDFKKLPKQANNNLRDHMTDLELILTMVGEATTTKLHQKRDSTEMPNLQKDAKDGGDVANKTKNEMEKTIGEKITSKENHLNKKENQKLD